MKLIIRLLIGMILGLVLGSMGPQSLLPWLVTGRALFSTFLNFIIPLVILFYVMSGIATLQKGSGRVLGLTVGLAYISTLGAGLLTFFAASELLPSMIHVASTELDAATTEIHPLFNLSIPPLLEVPSALLAAFLFGLGISSTRSTHLAQSVDQLRAVIERILLKALIPALPVYIACVFAEMAASGSAFQTLEAFIWVLGLAVILHWIWLFILYSITGSIVRKNPLTMLRTMLPAYFTALGTLSSAATIPVTVDSARNLKLNRHVVDFVVPLGATIHLCGSAITLTTCALAVMLITSGTALELSSFLPFLLALGVTMIAAPGIPGGGVMASVGLLTSMLGFGDAAIALMITLYLAQDGFGTACNVTGDGAIASLVNAAGSDRWRS